jgi:hypothetical protein
VSKGSGNGEARTNSGAVGFGQKGHHYFGQPDPPPNVVTLIVSNALLLGLRAFETMRVCHKGVTGDALLTEIVMPNQTVTDI